MNIAELRAKYGQALARAQALMTTLAASEAPSDEDRAAFDAATAEAQGLRDQVEAHNQRAATVAALAEFGRGSDWTPTPMGPHNDAGNTRNGRHAYSLIRAIQGQLAAINGTGGLTGIEAEVHADLVARRGAPASGVMIPLDAPVQYRDLSTTTGTGAVQASLDTARMIDILRARLVFDKLGVNVITDMPGPFSIPRTTTAPTVAPVVTEGTLVAASNPVLDKVNFTDKSVEAHVKLTRQFIGQASISAETYVVNQLTNAIARTVEDKAFNGAGSGGEPKGLFKYVSGDGVNTLVIGAAGGNPTWTQLMSMTGKVDTANAPDDARNWLINPTTKSYFQTLPKVSGQAVFVLGESDTIGGYGYASTSAVPNNITKSTGTDLSAMAFGAWSEMLVALFTGVDIMIDPFSAAPHVNITAALDYDVQFAHLASFCHCLDVKTV